MMENYLDPEEEFMLMHQEDFEVMAEMEEEEQFVLPSLEPPKQSKRSLDFGQPANNALKRANSMGVEPMVCSNSSNSESEDRGSSAEVAKVRKKPFVKRSLDAEFTSSSATTFSKKDKENYEEYVEPALSEETVRDERRRSDPEGRKKRSVDYLFGDIDDIELEESMPSTSKKGQPNKRARRELIELSKQSPSPEKDFEEDIQTERILESRKTTNTHIRGRSKPEERPDRESDSITYGVPKWPFIVVTNSDGSRLYVRLKSENKLEKECDEVSAHGRVDLLSQSYSAVKADATLLLAKRQMEMIESESSTASSHQNASKPGNTKLWVEKYKPKNYSELLSDTTINRSLLRWLKLWDKVVFDIDVQPTQKKQIQQEMKGQWNNNPNPNPNNNYFNNSKWNNNSNNTKWNNNPPWKNKGAIFVNEELDENDCPKQKVVLLCGPPGLGKTTLAHIVATKAGYNVVEMNASDDRSPELFRTQLEAATQMTSVMGKDPRPNCLVLDEIDGAPAPSIDVLIKFIAGKENAKTRGKKKEGRGFVLKRPIICICNDPYVPALRALRQVALLVSFPQTSAEVLCNRLLEIARRERIRTDLGAMLALCEKTQNDIRSCLSSLYYYKTKGGSLTLSEILRSNVGQKDVHKGLFAVWQDIFHIPRVKGAHTVALSKNLGNSPIVEQKSEIRSRFDNVLHSVQTFGDYDRLANGVFENYPNMKFRDSSMKEVSIGTEWFCRMDLITTHINTTQDYTLMPYIPYAFTVWHMLFASRQRPKISYPNASYEASVKLANVKYIIDEVMKGMSPAVRSHYNRCQLILEVLPYLTDIIVPLFRPVSLELYSFAEKQVLQNVVNIMIDFNLSYVQERTLESLYVSKLDPNILEVVYGDKGAPARKLTHTAKQIISREIERERMRRLDIYLDDTTQNKDNASKRPAPVNKPVPLVLEKPKFNPIFKDVPKKDFFGRIISEPDSPRTIKAKTVHTVKGNIWFHFKEGFNNAVRRRIKMEALM